MDHLILLTLIYLCMIGFQYIYLKYRPHPAAELDKKIKFNIENKNKIDEEFLKELNNRVYLLESKQMTLTEWYKYNMENNTIKIGEYSYYIFGHEKVEDSERFICRMNANKLFVGLSWEDILKELSENYVFSKFEVDPHQALNLYSAANENETGAIIKYYWVNANPTTNIAKISRGLKFQDPITKKMGVIGIGMEVDNLDNNNYFNYYNTINFGYIVFVSLLSFVMSVIVYKISNPQKNYYKSTALLIIANIYILFFIKSSELFGDSKLEINKQTNINSGILSASFLVGVNVFILNTLQSSIKKDLFLQSGFVFAISLILLLMVSFKTTGYSTIEDIVKIRLSKQFLFNFSILLNALIIINYIIYILSNKVKYLV